MKFLILNKIAFSLLFITCFSDLCHAQSASGGGLLIEKTYASNLKAIAYGKDKSLEIRSFYLDGRGILCESFMAQEFAKNKKIYLKPNFIDVSELRDEPKKAKWQRLLLVLAGDTMILDLLNMLTEQENKIVDAMDSLVFMKGYFRMDRCHEEGKWSISQFEKYRTSAPILHRGLTPNSRKLLEASKLLTYQTSCTDCLFEEQDLEYRYFVNAAHYFIGEKKYKEARQYLSIAISKNRGLKNARIDDLEQLLYIHSGK